MTVSTSTTFLSTTVAVSGASCTCNKVLKEIHYTAYTTGGDKITSITADVVYVDLAAATCADTLRYEQIYSFTFKESLYSRIQSGSPGYAKGLPLLAGKLSTTTTNSIEANESGFQLYGADDNGDCLIQTSVSPNSFYYSNPTLNFVDNAMYG